MNSLRSSQSRPAFTLVEILVVTLIIALSAAAAGALFARSYQRRQLEQTAHELLYMAQHARLFAVNHRKPCRLHLLSKEKSFYLTTDVTDPDSDTPRLQVIHDFYTQPVTLPHAVRWQKIDIHPRAADNTLSDNQPADRVRFLPDSTADHAVLQLTNDRHTFTLIIDPHTAQPRLHLGAFDDLPDDTEDLDLD